MLCIKKNCLHTTRWFSRSVLFPSTTNGKFSGSFGPACTRNSSLHTHTQRNQRCEHIILLSLMRSQAVVACVHACVRACVCEKKRALPPVLEILKRLRDVHIKH